MKDRHIIVAAVAAAVLLNIGGYMWAVDSAYREGYRHGTALTTFRIAQGCALDGQFDHDGHEFYCGDVEDMGPFVSK